MRLIVGLGNPGLEYSETRHNAGRLVVEQIARENSLRFSHKGKLKASLVKANIEGQEVILAYPEVFMNLSGETVALLVKHFSVKPENELLLVVDEVALPYKSLRLRAKGSAGGHNGLKSVEANLQTSGYARLRVGIGPEDSKNTGRPQGDMPLEAFVLKRFSSAERKELPDFLSEAAEACRRWITRPIGEVMNIVNH